MPRFILPFGFIFLRVFVSLGLFAIIFFLFYREKIQPGDWLRFFFCGIFGIAANQLMFFYGINQTSAIHGSLLMITSPMITFIIYQCIVKENQLRSKIIGIGLGMVGAAVLIFSSVTDKGSASAIGDIFVVLNAISFSIYLIIVKPLMLRYHPLSVTFYSFLFGSIWVAIFGFQEIIELNVSAIPSFYYIHFGFVIIGATFIVYLLNIIAIQTVSATTVSSFIYLQPLFAIIISLGFTDERMTLYAVVGGIMIIFGLWLFNHKR